jgi:hypothetical protein
MQDRRGPAVVLAQNGKDSLGCTAAVDAEDASAMFPGSRDDPFEDLALNLCMLAMRR